MKGSADKVARLGWIGGTRKHAVATDSTRWTLRMLRVVACSAGRAWYYITPHVPCMRLDPASHAFWASEADWE